MQVTIKLTKSQAAALAIEQKSFSANPSESLDEYIARYFILQAKTLRDKHLPDAVHVGEFIARIPPASYAAAVEAAANIPELQTYLNQLKITNYVWLDAPEVIAGVNALVKMGFITQNDSDKILSF